MSKFQIIVLGIFILAIIVGVIMFATFRGSGSSNQQLDPITVWGTFPESTFNNYVSKINQKLSLPISVTYVQKNQNSFSQEFISALARGSGPDGILIPADALLPHLDKITPVPYSALSQRSFIDSYINEAQIYTSDKGILALPLVVDPLLMYWNRDTFAGAGIATYPRYWDEFGDLVKKLTSLDEKNNIRKTAIAMGDFTNVANARELLGTLILQLGNPITIFNLNGMTASTLHGNGFVSPSAAINYFVQFADPNNANYSWNRGMPNSKTAFLSGMLATYFGFASEITDLRAKNPNLNFDVASMPQLRSGGVKATYGRLYGLSIVKASPKQNSTYQIFSVLTNPSFLPTLSEETYLPSVNTALISKGSDDPYITIFDQAALISKTWLDADRNQSYRIFGNMIGAIISGSKSVSDAIEDASEQYDVILKQSLQ